jgi:hypothetical protein
MTATVLLQVVPTRLIQAVSSQVATSLLSISGLLELVASLLTPSTLLQDDNNLFQTCQQLGTSVLLKSCKIFTRVSNTLLFIIADILNYLFQFIFRAVKFSAKLMGKAMAKRQKVTVLYATETGKSEHYANLLKELFSYAFNPRVSKLRCTLTSNHCTIVIYSGLAV